MSKNIILPPDNCTNNILEYFQRYNLKPYVCLHPFIKLPNWVNYSDYYVDHYDNGAVGLIMKKLFLYRKDIANQISWEDVISEMGFSSISYLNEVLLSDAEEISRSDRFDFNKLKIDAERLSSWLESQNILSPFGSVIPIEYESSILKSMLEEGYETALFSDEFGSDITTIILKPYLFSLENNLENFDVNFRSICTHDLKITYTVLSDTFFTVLAAEENMLNNIISRHKFDGIYPTRKMTYML